MMMRISVIAAAAMLLMCTACSSTTTGTGGGGQPQGQSSGTTPGAPQCASGKYTANVEGAPANATLVIEVVGEVTYVSGEIRSATAYYLYKGEASGAGRAFVDVTEVNTGERFRAQLDTQGNDFVFTANAFEGAASTAYLFKCQG